MAAGMVLCSNISMKQIDEISKKKEVEKQVSIQNIGYAKLRHSKNETSPYLYIGGLNGDYETLLPFYRKRDGCQRMKMKLFCRLR